jgi:hypothetical protein
MLLSAFLAKFGRVSMLTLSSRRVRLRLIVTSSFTHLVYRRKEHSRTAFDVHWMVKIPGLQMKSAHVEYVRVLVGPPRASAVRRSYTIVEARMAYRMIV